MFSVILSVLSCTLITPPSLLLASRSFITKRSSTPPVVELAYASLVVSSFASISPPVDAEQSWYSVFPEIFIFAPVVEVEFNVLSSNKSNLTLERVKINSLGSSN